MPELVFRINKNQTCRVPLTKPLANDIAKAMKHGVRTGVAIPETKWGRGHIMVHGQTVTLVRGNVTTRPLSPGKVARVRDMGKRRW